MKHQKHKISLCDGKKLSKVVGIPIAKQKRIYKKQRFHFWDILNKITNMIYYTKVSKTRWKLQLNRFRIKVKTQKFNVNVFKGSSPKN